MMEKKQALRILVKHSFALSDKVKDKILASIDNLSDEEIADMGIFLATEKRKSLRAGKRVIESLDEIEEAIRNG